MNKLHKTALCSVLLATAAMAEEGYRVSNTYYDAARTIPKLEFNPSVANFQNLRGLDLAKAYIQANYARYGLANGLDGLRLADTKSSLLGTHYYFQQINGELPVEGAELIISVNQSGDAIYMVYNAIHQESGRQEKLKTQDARISQDQAFDIAWKAVSVRGSLQQRPSARLVGVVYKNKTRLAYKVTLGVSKPLGSWETLIDAKTGTILGIDDRTIPRKAGKRGRAYNLDGPITNRALAFRNWAQKEQLAAKVDGGEPTFTVEQGKGLVFDPDPRTTLNDDTLVDSSAENLFDPAYFKRELRDISFDGQKYTLKGPWVEIADFEAPATAPSSSTTGEWTDKRGKNAFNDVMTYFHIDQNQRYIQNLGFKDGTGIQFGSMKADSDGLSGDDNSHFDGLANRIAFGHGCVDDNEDADVILHEYGHAIQHSINKNWKGGDTGSMGEGFGDYWAASYSIKTPNGPNFNVNYVFSWDGHGPNNPCWPGRILNASNLKYEPGRTYGAHEAMGGGRYTDELWSTPLFQSLLQLKAQSVDITELDRVVLQSHFGLGSSVKMRDMANATIKAAQMLYPKGPHSKVLAANFAAQSIIEVPQPKLSVAFKTTPLSNDGQVYPGDKFTLEATVKNVGTKAATGVKGSASSTDANVSFDPADLTYGEIAPNVSASDTVTVAVGADAVCGSEIPVEVKVTQANFPEVSGLVNVRVGKEQGVAKSETADVSIPDNNTSGLTRSLTIENIKAKVSKNFNLQINIQHPYRGDLKVVLVSPAGTQVVLHDRSGSGADNLTGTYPLDLSPKESLDKIVGEALQGTWKLIVSDGASNDTGSLVSWGIKDVSGYSCER